MLFAWTIPIILSSSFWMIEVAPVLHSASRINCTSAGVVSHPSQALRDENRFCLWCRLEWCMISQNPSTSDNLGV